MTGFWVFLTPSPLLRQVLTFGETPLPTDLHWQNYLTKNLWFILRNKLWFFGKVDKNFIKQKIRPTLSPYHILKMIIFLYLNYLNLSTLTSPWSPSPFIDNCWHLGNLLSPLPLNVVRLAKKPCQSTREGVSKMSKIPSTWFMNDPQQGFLARFVLPKIVEKLP